MSPQEQGFDLALVCAGSQCCIPKAAGQIQGCIVVSMIAVLTGHTRERALVGTVGPICVVAVMTLL
jgi:hypothetical protein